MKELDIQHVQDQVDQMTDPTKQTQAQAIVDQFAAQQKK
jgi:hypothetical protein